MKIKRSLQRLLQLTHLQKFIQITLFVGVVFTIYSCSNNNQAEEIVPPGMQLLDLSYYGKPFSVYVPDTINQKLTITEMPTGALDVRSGEKFAISIYEQATDIDLTKSDISGDDVNKLKTILIDEPSMLMWESEITRPEFHFVLNKSIAGSEYSIEDTRDNDIGIFSKEDIERMLNSSKMIKVREN
jgi:hypothetical protein